MFEGFPSFSYKLFPDMSNLSTASERSVHSDNAYLRECLEKERYRRKVGLWCRSARSRHSGHLLSFLRLIDC